ncbi:MAG: ATP-binding protein [Bacteroidota bacterium]
MELSVISGKGGTGKSNLAASLVSLASSVILADCDVDAANQHILFQPDVCSEEAFTGSENAVIDTAICTNCGICAQHCRFGAINHQQNHTRISDIFCDGCGFCVTVCPEGAISMQKHNKSRLFTGNFRYGEMVYGILAPGEENSGKLVNLVKNKARDLARKKQIRNMIIDGPPGLGCPVISSISGATDVVVVCEPSLSAIHDLERVLSLLQRYNFPVWIVINKFDLNLALAQIIEEKICDNRHITLAGKIPFDENVVRAMAMCKTIVEYKPDSTAARAIHHIYNQIFCDKKMIETENEKGPGIINGNH